MPAFQPYWGKPAVRNDREDRGNVGIIRSPVRASIPPDHFGHERLDRHYARGAIKLQRLRATWWGTNKTRLGLRCAETYGPRYFASNLLEAQAGRAYGRAARIACAICFPFTSAASTVPISRPAYSASPEKNTAPSSIFRSAVCACRVSGVA
jgi:hypothetical protein